MQIRNKFLVAAFLNIMILGCIVGVVFRILKRMRKKEKETLILKIKELEEKLKPKKEENSS